MLLRTAISNSTRKPMSDPSEKLPRVANIVRTPPTNADGTGGKDVEAGRSNLLPNKARKNLGVIFKRELHGLKATSNIRSHSLKVTALHHRLYVEISFDRVVLYHCWNRYNANLGNIAQAHLLATGCFNQHLVDATHTAARFRGAPYHHIEYFLFFKKVTNHNT